MRVALTQFAAGLGKEANLARLEISIATAAEDGASLVVAPEAAMHDFGPDDVPLGPAAEPLDGPFVTSLAAAAAKHRVTVVAGMFEAVPDDPDRVYNTVVAIGPGGDLIGSYRKQHLFDALGWVESDRLVAGAPEGRLVFDCGEMAVGVMTCYDVRFPELARALVDDGATLLAIPSAWVAGEGKAAQWRTLTAARAVENVCYVAGAVQSPPLYTGYSCLVDPWGEVLAGLDEGTGVTVGDVSATRVAECRDRMPVLANRRWQVAPRR